MAVELRKHRANLRRFIAVLTLNILALICIAPGLYSAPLRNVFCRWTFALTNLETKHRWSEKSSSNQYQSAAIDSLKVKKETGLKWYGLALSIESEIQLRAFKLLLENKDTAPYRLITQIKTEEQFNGFKKHLEKGERSVRVLWASAHLKSVAQAMESINFKEWEEAFKSNPRALPLLRLAKGYLRRNDLSVLAEAYFLAQRDNYKYDHEGTYMPISTFHIGDRMLVVAEGINLDYINSSSGADLRRAGDQRLSRCVAIAMLGSFLRAQHFGKSVASIEFYAEDVRSDFMEEILLERGFKPTVALNGRGEWFELILQRNQSPN